MLGDANYENPQHPYPRGLHRSPASYREAHISWRATFHSWNPTTIKPKSKGNGCFWITQQLGVAYRPDQVTHATQYDLATASAQAGPRSRPNLDYETATHRAIFCDKDEDYYSCPQYRWSDAMVWREETNYRLTEIQNDWVHRRSLSLPPTDHRDRVVAACTYALPDHFQNLRFSTHIEDGKMAESPKCRAMKVKVTPLNPLRSQKDVEMSLVWRRSIPKALLWNHSPQPPVLVNSPEPGQGSVLESMLR